MQLTISQAHSLSVYAVFICHPPISRTLLPKCATIRRRYESVYSIVFTECVPDILTENTGEIQVCGLAKPQAGDIISFLFGMSFQMIQEQTSRQFRCLRDNIARFLKLLRLQLLLVQRPSISMTAPYQLLSLKERALNSNPLPTSSLYFQRLCYLELFRISVSNFLPPTGKNYWQKQKNVIWVFATYGFLSRKLKII